MSNSEHVYLLILVSLINRTMSFHMNESCKTSTETLLALVSSITSASVSSVRKAEESKISHD